ncbi:MAG: hypothetical protein CO189_07615 [candidate division Zixibacteria bacterium CG_4_9_14_3_um_filter_46_8]|nr:MAG: hypothetical protein CO189_07615 [candidate division Zixibacteria bacterium CG_4_9_14_3_um_filter_46_8]
MPIGVIRNLLVLININGACAIVARQTEFIDRTTEQLVKWTALGEINVVIVRITIQVLLTVVHGMALVAT